MKKAMLYVHGKGGNAAEADYYKKLCPGYDIYGVDYTEDLPRIVREQIKNAYDGLKDRYDEISLITNSIGTFFAMLSLQKDELRKVYCISPILNMERLITDMMSWAGVSQAELKEKKRTPAILEKHFPGSICAMCGITRSIGQCRQRFCMPRRII